MKRHISLAWFRQATGYTSEKMAKILGLNSRQAYDYLEKKGNLTADHLVRLQKYLNAVPVYIGLHRMTVEEFYKPLRDEYLIGFVTPELFGSLIVWGHDEEDVIAIAHNIQPELIGQEVIVMKYDDIPAPEKERLRNAEMATSEEFKKIFRKQSE